MKNTRGETLVETVVAFSVLLILISMLGTVLQASARMNSRARVRLSQLEEACAIVEQDLGVYGDTTYTLTLKPTTGGDDIVIPLDVRQDRSEEPMLIYFEWANNGG